MYLSRVTLKSDICRNTQLGKLLKKSSYNTHQLLWDLFDQPKRDFLYREEIAKEQIPSHSGAKGEPVYYLLSPKQPKDDTPLFKVETKKYQPEFYQGQRLSFRLRANPVVTKKGKRHDLVMDEQLVFFKRVCADLGIAPENSKADLKKSLIRAKPSTNVCDWLCSYLSQTRYFASAQSGLGIERLLDIALQEAISERLIKWLSGSKTRTGIFQISSAEIEDEISEQTRIAPLFQWYGYRTHSLEKSKDLTLEKRPMARFLSVEMSGELEIDDPTRFQELIKQGIGPAKGFGCGLMMVRPI